LRAFRVILMINIERWRATGMQDLRVIGVENGALLAAADDGSRFRIPIDELMQAKLRQAIPAANAGKKMSPREIQAQIRSGLSAHDVSTLTGVPLEYISRFEGPVLAEREFIVTSALNVEVQTARDADPFTHGTTFGAAIRQRLLALNAVNERWASWKEESSGWVVKLSFTADQIDHDARWSFEPRKNSLAPLNNEASTLSQQGDVPSVLIPRLRVVNGSLANSGELDVDSIANETRASDTSGGAETPSALTEPDRSRFDSGAFDLAKHENEPTPAGVREAILSRFAPGTDATAVQKGTPQSGMTQTADLLDELRRRRGEREAANYPADDDGAYPGNATREGAFEPQVGLLPAITPGSSGIRLVDVPLEKYLAADSPQNTMAQQVTAPQPTTLPTTQPKTGRKGRAAMPSWDDIVFGARPDELS